MGVSSWLHGKVILPPGRNPGRHSQSGQFLQLWCPDWVWEIQTASWFDEDRTWGTQLFVVLKKFQLKLIYLINITIHPPVSL
jgi:hypothetical protein